MKVPFFDLRPQHAPLTEKLQHEFTQFFDEPEFILGPQVERFEQEFACFLDVRHAIGVSSGTDALVCALLALNIGEGDEVITSPFTFAATAEAILRVGAVPRFVDIDPVTFNIDSAAIEPAITARTRAILPVHLFGVPADMAAIMALADKHGVQVLEDAAQALGARYSDRSVGGFGDLAAFSFFPSKPLGAWGDGGMIVTNDGALAARCRQLRCHGKNAQGQFERLGGNFRLDAVQAALLRVKLPHVPQWQAARTELVANYSRELEGLPGITVPQVASSVVSACSLYTLRVTSHLNTPQGNVRDLLRAALLERGIQSAVYYPRPLHQEPLFRRGHSGSGEGEFPVAEAASRQVLSLPLFPGLTQRQQQWVIAAVREFCGS